MDEFQNTNPIQTYILSEIKKFRIETKLPVGFTIDAGPNIHLLYPGEIKDEVNNWIKKQLPDYWNENKLIFDNEQAILDVYQKYQKLIFAHPVSETEALEVKHDLSQIDKHKADLNEDLIVEKLDRLSQMIEDTKTSLPSEFVKVWDENLKLQKKSSVTGKFKLVIPIIPKIFTYEKEMPYNLVEEFKQMRKDFKNGHYFLYPKTI